MTNPFVLGEEGICHWKRRFIKGTWLRQGTCLLQWTSPLLPLQSHVLLSSLIKEYDAEANYSTRELVLTDPEEDKFSLSSSNMEYVTGVNVSTASIMPYWALVLACLDEDKLTCHRERNMSL